MSRTRRLVVASVLGCLGVWSVAACGSSDDTPSEVTESTTTRADGSTTVADGAVADDVGADATTIDPDFRSTTYSDPRHWLCNPDGDLGSCDIDRDLTAVGPDASLTVEPFGPASNPNIDCFYIYPTISSDTTPNADLNPDNSEMGAVASQFSRFGSVCRLFAPVYRQTPLAALAGAFGGPSSQSGEPKSDPELAYNDVRDAFRHYLATANEVDGTRRGFVLIGHSQGARLLTQLISEEIDPNPDQRALLVSALLIGSSVTVPAGKDVGGDFKAIPACRSLGQTGCVVSFASFRSTSPPPEESRFGRPRQGAGESLCTNPAALTGGSAELHMALVDKSRVFADAATAPEIATRFVSMPGLLSGECVKRDGFNYLEVTVHGDPSDKRTDDIGGDLTPSWGLHLVDMQITGNDLVALVQAQAAAWRDPKPE